MKYFARFVANAICIFLALYLVDSVSRGRFLIGGVGIAVLLSLLLGLANSSVRPLHRMRTKTRRALVGALLTLVANALIIQIFSWISPLSAANLSITLLVAAFVTLLAGTMNWLIGFSPPAKSRRSSSVNRQTPEKAKRSGRGR